MLLLLQNLLSNPVLKNAINNDAKQMLLCLPHAYKQIATDCVINSQKIEGEQQQKSWYFPLHLRSKLKIEHNSISS